MKEKNERKIQLIILAICLIVFLSLVFFAHSIRPQRTEMMGVYVERGRVVAIVDETTEHNPALGLFPQQRLDVQLSTGEFAGYTFEISNNLLDHRMRHFDVGDRLILEFTEQSSRILSLDRGNILLGLAGLFLLLLALIGGKRGLLSIGGLIFSLLAIVLILVPFTLAGFNPILIAILVSGLMTVVGITLLAGFTPKAITAIIGSLSGIALAALLATITGHLTNISGYHTEYAGFLLGVSEGELPLSGIFVSGLIIAAMGAITDTAMTIASSMEEVKLAKPNITFKDLALAGLNVGRDAMGTMSNTLILAFVGSSFSLILFLSSIHLTWTEFINNDGIGIEIILGLAGSLGIILTVPLTTFIGAKLLSSKN